MLHVRPNELAHLAAAELLRRSKQPGGPAS